MQPPSLFVLFICLHPKRLSPFQKKRTLSPFGLITQKVRKIECDVERCMK